MTEKAPDSLERYRPPLLVAEIGTGGLDVGYDVTRLPEDSTIVTIDLLRGVGASAGHHSVSKIPDLYTNRAQRLKESGQNVPKFEHAPVFADGREAPFNDETFDYVLLSSVISDPGISETDASRLLEEALRIVKPEGLVILRDDLTPFITDDRLTRSNAESDKILHVIDAEDDDEQFSRSRKAWLLVNNPHYFSPVIKMITRGEHYEAGSLKVYTHQEWRNKLAIEKMAAAKEARSLKRRRLMAKVGLKRSNDVSGKPESSKE